MGLPDRDYYLKDDANSTKIRGEYEHHVASMLRFAGDTPQAAAAGAKAVVTIETALARDSLDRASQRNPTNVYHRMPRDEVKKLMPNFNLSSFMELAEAPPGDSANVSEPEFLKAVDQVIASNSLADLKTYMRWHVVHATAEELPKGFDEENFNFYGKTLTGATEQSPRWKRCAQAVDSDLGEALGKVYVQRTFGPEGKARTLEMVQNIEAAMSSDIAQVDWMTADTKKAAETKLRDVANKIGYPDMARLFVALDRARRLLRQLATRKPVRLPPPDGQDRQAGRQDRMVHDATDGQRVLQSAGEQHQFPRGHPAAAVLQPKRGRRGQLRCGGRRRRARADARLRRSRPPLR